MAKWSRTLGLLLSLVMLVAGCGSSGQPAGGGDGPSGSGDQQSPPAAGTQPQAPATPAPSGRTTLQMWIMPNTTQSEQDMLQLLQPFMAEHNVDVQVTVIDWSSAWTRITAAATSGEGPDVLQLGTTWVPAIAAMGALEPLSGKVAEIGGADAFYPASWNTVSIAGDPEVYAVPWFIDVRAAYYRTDVFQKAGVDPQTAFRDWESFKAALHQINGTEIEGRPVAAIGFPGKNDWNVTHNIMPWVWGAGGSELSADLRSSAINSEEALDGVMFYTGLVREGLVPPGVLEKNTSDAEMAFHTGEFAVFFNGPWMVSQYTRPESENGHADKIAAQNYGVAPIPEGPRGRYTFFGGSNLAIFNTSRHKELSWELVKFLVGKEAQMAYGEMAGMLPALKALEPDMVALNANFAPFYEAARYGRSYASIPQWGPVETVYTKHLSTIWDLTAGVSGTYSREAVKQVLDEAAREATSLLNQ